MMNTDSFYAILSGICFALTGLWWTVVEGRPDWLKDAGLRGLAGGVYASFLLPGVMSLGAQIGGDNKLVWRAVFVIAALMGMFFTARLLGRLRRLEGAGFFARSRWAVILLYGVVLVLGLFPELTAPTGLKPIQVEAFLLCIIVLTGHGLAWEMMTHKPG
jgi:hypothetical protein